jgi:radical SAM protein with 4Fe4S-binding SPASM domain
VPSPNDYLRLTDSCFLKQLEEPFIYNIATDELYETNQEAFDFLRQCDGSHRINKLTFEQQFLNWCRKEGIISTLPKRSKRTFIIEPVSSPSLRYLELQITSRCNLTCKHCYLGEAKPLDLPLKTVLRILKEFERMQGLRLLLSGGEPLLYGDFWTLNDALPDFGLRSVLLTNGTLINRTTARNLKVHEIQVSLDGIGDSHEFIRGKRSYTRALRAISELRNLGKDVSVATMVHARNIDEFTALSELVKTMGIKEWNIDVPCAAGRLAAHKELQVDYSAAAPLLNYSFGGGLYTSSGKFACGAHLCTIFPDGKVAKCGFFGDEPVGYIDEGLKTCWERVEHIRLEQLDCQCKYVQECRGGCRYRALLSGNRFSPDPVQCTLRGVSSK